MIECDKCPDKLRCTTGQVNECSRGFKLKMCCRKYLSGRKEDIIRMLIDMPNEMITENFVTYKDVCPMCRGEIVIRLNMCNAENDTIKRLESELRTLRKIADLTPKTFPPAEPYYPPYYPPFQGPYVVGDPSPKYGTWTVSCDSKSEPKGYCASSVTELKDEEEFKERMCVSSVG